jgi:hypothetical protein
MLYNSLRNLSYQDGIVTFDFALEALRGSRGSSEEDSCRIQIPFRHFAEMIKFLQGEVAEIAIVHKSWLEQERNSGPSNEQPNITNKGDRPPVGARIGGA